MAENLIKIPKGAKIRDDFSIKKDKQKAYQIFLFSGISAIALTVLMYLL